MGPHENARQHRTAALGAPPFQVGVDLRAGRVSVAGEMDREHAHHVLDALTGLSDTDHAVWTLDARRVTFCDAEGLRSLVTARRLARGRGRGLSVLPSPCMHRLVLLVGMDQLLATPPAPAEIMADVARNRRAHAELVTVRQLRRPAAMRTPDASSAG